jgi:hypothetical protein
MINKPIVPLIFLILVSSTILPISAVSSNQQFHLMATPQDSIKPNNSLGSIAMGMTEQQVVKRLGKPRRITTAYDNCSGNNFQTFAYRQLEVVIRTNTVVILRTSSPKYATSSGIRVGDSIDKLQSIYPNISLISEKSIITHIAGDNSGIYLYFGHKNNKITTIEIFLDDC